LSDIVKIKGKSFPVLLALTQQEQERGLMYVDPPAPSMAFIYAKPKFNSFWMRSTKVPLDIVFCLNNKISSIWQGEPYSTRVIGGHEPSDLVLEFAQGTCKSYGFSAGDEISIEYSDASKMKVFALKNSILF
jgi:uncharacterized membrane protein (UPF0127 family)